MRVETFPQRFLEGKTGPRAPLRLKFEDSKGEVVKLTGVGDGILAVHADFQFPRLLSIYLVRSASKSEMTSERSTFIINAAP